MLKNNFISLCLVALLVISTLVAESHAAGMDDYNQAQAFAKEGDYESAIKMIHKALDSGDLDQRFTVGSHQSLGNYYRRMNQFDKAVDSYKAALELDSTGKTPLFQLGTLYVEKEEFATAIDYFDRSLEVDEVFLTVPTLLARAAANAGLGNYEEAERDFQRALDYDEASSPTDEWYFFYLSRGRYMESLGKFVDAMNDYDKAIELQVEQQFPNWPASLRRDKARLLAASPLEHMRDGEEALRLIKDIIDRDPSWEVDYSIMAAAYAEVGDFESAEQAQLQSIQMLRRYSFEEKIKDRESRLELYRAGKPFRLSVP